MSETAGIYQPQTPPLAIITVRGHPVSVNEMYGSRARGGRYLTPEARCWKYCVRDEAAFAWRSLRDRVFVAHSLRIHVNIFGWRGDADNVLKLVLDGLKEGILIDDRHYNHVEAVKDVRKGFRGVEIRVWGEPIIDLELEAAVDRGMALGLARTIGATS